MLGLQKIVYSTSILVLLSGCNQLDDYMLGKDNTPVPSTLDSLHVSSILQEKWSAPTGSTKKSLHSLKLKPVLVGSTVYMADASGVVQALNKKNGSIVWSKKINHGILSGPSLGAGYVLVSTDASTVLALKQSTGEEVWQQNVSSDVLGKVVIVQDKVIVKTIDGNLYALDLSTGKQRWISEHGAPGLILKASASPVIMNNRIALVGYSDGKMDAVDIQNGHVIWQRSIAYARGASDVERLVDIDADPVVQNNVVLLASYQGYVGAMSLTDGQFIWRKPASTFTNFVVQGNTLFMVDSDDVIWAINKQNGQVLWKQDQLKARALTEPVLVGDNKLALGDKTGLLHVLSTQTGEFVSRVQLSGAITIAPAVAGNHIYVMTTNGKLSCFKVS